MTLTKKTMNSIILKFSRLYHKIKLSLPSNKINDYIKTMIMSMEINQRLERYKGINYGKDVYIIGGGPSVKKFNRRKSNKDVYIGINRAYKDNRLEFDYLFVQDELPEGFDEFIEYRGDNCIKFLAVIPSNEHFRIREFNIRGKYERYVLASRRMKEVPFDISIEPFADLRGTVFSAVQFAVYTNPKHIYLVGFDCSQGNVYNKTVDNYTYQLQGWKILKESMIKLGVANRIVSINPVGLKGFFTDIYLDS